MNANSVYCLMMITSLASGLVSTAFVSEKTYAQDKSETLISLSIQEPPATKPPQETASAGSRAGSCVTEKQPPFLAIMPRIYAEEQGIDLYFLMSATENPSLFFYIPQITKQDSKLTLLDENGNTVYEKNFTIKDYSGLVKLNLPVSLKANQSYYWNFVIICDPSKRTDKFELVGIIKYTPLNNKQEEEIKQAQKPIDLAEVYGKYSFGSQTISLAVENKKEYPQEWQSLLKSMGIEDKTILESPLIGTIDLPK